MLMGLSCKNVVVYSKGKIRRQRRIVLSVIQLVSDENTRIIYFLSAHPHHILRHISTSDSLVSESRLLLALEKMVRIIITYKMRTQTHKVHPVQKYEQLATFMDTTRRSAVLKHQKRDNRLSYKT